MNILKNNSAQNMERTLLDMQYCDSVTFDRDMF